MNKLKKQFILFENKAFGYGYGSGEIYVLTVFKRFLQICPVEGNYDYHILENLLTPPIAWLLINILCREEVLEYGTSPRFGWLSSLGIDLKIFTEEHTVEELAEMLNLSEEEKSELYGIEENNSAEEKPTNIKG